MARAKENFTVNSVAKATCPDGKQQDISWDAKAPGLGVRVTASGAKSYIFEAWLRGDSVRVTIGDVKTWPLDGPSGSTHTARAEATRLKMLCDQGIDPRVEAAERREKAKEAAIAAKSKKQSGIEVWKLYVAQRQAKWSEAHLADHHKVVQPGGEKRKRGRRKGESELTQSGALLPLLQMPLSQIDQDAVRNWLNGEATKRPTHARLCYGLLRAFLNWCADQKEYAAFTHVDACAAKVAKDVLPKKAAKDDCLQREQLAAWFREVGKLSLVQSTYLQMVLLVGARRNELTDLKWEDVDFKWDSLVIGDKMEGTRVIPLPPYLKSLLQKLKAANETPPPKHRILNGKKVENDLSNWVPSQWVFASKAARSGHLEEPKQAHNRAIAAAGLPPLSIHGLRRSFSTLSEWCEVPAGIVAQIQGHAPSATAEKHYKKRPLDLLRVWHVRIEEWMLKQAGIEQPNLESTPGSLKAVA